MQIARQNFLAGAAFAGDQHRGVGAGDLLGELDHARHGVVAVDHIAAVIGDGGQHRRDQLRIGRQRDVFLGAGMDGAHRGAGIVGHAAGDDRHVDAFGIEPVDQVADVQIDVDEQQVGAAPGAQHRQRLLVVSAWVTAAPLAIAILLAVVSWPPSVPTIKSRMAVSLLFASTPKAGVSCAPT